MRPWIRIILFTVSSAVFAASAGQILSVLKERQDSVREYKQARETFLTEKQRPSGDPFPELEVQLEELKRVNPDGAAWIYYPEAGISYPVALEREEEAGKYLHTTFEGAENPAGCIYMPAGTDPGLHQLNTFLYGHNMKDGTMFGSLKEIFRQPEAAEDPYFYLWTQEQEVIHFRVFALCVTENDSPLYTVPLNKEAYSGYIEAVMAQSVRLPLDEAETEAIKEGRPLVTLSTCYGAAGSTKRLLIFGVEIERRSL